MSLPLARLYRWASKVVTGEKGFYEEVKFFKYDHNFDNLNDSQKRALSLRNWICFLP